MRVGLDFDNTIVSYDKLFATLAAEEGLFDVFPGTDKKSIRDELRKLDDGEETWHRLQALAYGLNMNEAIMFDGAADFIADCRHRDIPVFIVSHKTRRPAYRGIDVDLREAALNWMTAKSFFSDDGLGLSPSDVFFEDTRHAKVARIASLQCSHFVDDLEEVFAEVDFPDLVHKTLFAPNGAETELPDAICSDWKQISHEFFGQSAVA